MKKSLIVSFLIFGLVQGRPNRGFKRFEDPFLRFEESDKVDRGRGEIERMNITSSIQMRYAITKVETRVKNAQNETQEIFFDVYIPNEAFVSNFSMTIKNTTYVAKVDTKESAQAIYDNSSSASSGLVQSRAEFKDIKHIQFSAKVDPGEKVTFLLTYEELLVRSNGKYDYQLHIMSKKQQIKNLFIRIKINETLPLRDVEVKKINDMNEIESKAQDMSNEVLFYDEKNDPKFAKIEYIASPNEMTQNHEWKLALKYDVQRPLDGNDIQIAGGRFVHYFAPDSLPSLPKHIIFVIDLSGSMHGRKLTQTIDAMTTILEKMNPEDKFNILVFSDMVSNWINPIVGSSLSRQVSESKRDALEYVLNLKSRGGTNINDAMLEALEVAKLVKTSEEIDDKTQQMIVFLTDGEATTGITDNEAIKVNIKSKNAELTIPIYGLAFGNGADFNLIKDISEGSEAFARRIYESGNSFEQLENFYQEIADPKLKNVEFKYLMDGEVLNQTSLTKTSIKNAYGSSEYVVVGTFDKDSTMENFEIILEGQGQNELEQSIRIQPCIATKVHSELEHLQEPTESEKMFLLPESEDSLCLPPFNHHRPGLKPSWQQTETEVFMERLWAFKRIKYLLESQENCKDTLNCSNKTFEAEALDLALKHNFVTKMTSLVVEAGDQYIKSITDESPDEKPRFLPHFYYNRAASYNAPVSIPFKKHNNGHFMRKASYSPKFSSMMASMSSIPMTSSPITSSPMTSTSMQSATDSFDYHDLLFSQETSALPTASETSTTTRGPCNGQVKLFRSTYLRGQPMIFDDSLDELEDFDNELASMEIQGTCCWKVFVGKNFTGRFQTYQPGKYESATMIKEVFKKASSFQKIQC